MANKAAYVQQVTDAIKATMAACIKAEEAVQEVLDEGSSDLAKHKLTRLINTLVGAVEPKMGKLNDMGNELTGNTLLELT